MKLARSSENAWQVGAEEAEGAMIDRVFIGVLGQGFVLVFEVFIQSSFAKVL